MKKFLAMLMALAMVLAMAACGSTSSGNNSGNAGDAEKTPDNLTLSGGPPTPLFRIAPCSSAHRPDRPH